MLKKAIIALTTGILILLFAVVFFGFIIETSYTFILMNAYWFNIEPKAIMIILAIIALLLTCIIFACILDKD